MMMIMMVTYLSLPDPMMRLTKKISKEFACCGAILEKPAIRAIAFNFFHAAKRCHATAHCY
jgi:hypothetical protein